MKGCGVVLEALASLLIGDRDEQCGCVRERAPCDGGVGVFEVLSGLKVCDGVFRQDILMC
jgi:hypothetical protein